MRSGRSSSTHALPRALLLVCLLLAFLQACLTLARPLVRREDVEVGGLGRRSDFDVVGTSASVSANAGVGKAKTNPQQQQQQLHVLPPYVPRPGNIVGARAKYYEVGSKETRMHPAIVLSGPDRAGFLRIVIVSNNLPGDGARRGVERYVGKGSIKGEVGIADVKRVRASRVVPWKMPTRRGSGSSPGGTGTGQEGMVENVYARPLTTEKLRELRKDVDAAVRMGVV